MKGVALRLSMLSLVLAMLLVGQPSRAQQTPHSDTEEDHVLSGTVLDKQSKAALPGVRISIGETKRGAISNAQGKYRISHLPHGVVAVRVQLIGYKVLVENIDINKVSEHNFELEESHIETPEVVVSGVSQATEKKRMPLPITIVSATELQDQSSTSVIAALASKPGIDALQSGPALAKPIIRGLGYNRVLVLHDGVRQEEQQWGDEHGVSVDAFSVNSVEILKGPASLMYGSDALAGVVNIQSTHALNEGERHVELQSELASNNGAYGLSLSTDGTYHQWFWDARLSTHSAHAYKNAADGYVLNSGFNDTAMRAVVGYQAHWGHSNLYASHYTLHTGIIEGTRDSVGHFSKEQFSNGQLQDVEATDADFLSRTPLVPYQRIVQNDLHLENYVELGSVGLYATLGWQQNLRREYADVAEPALAGLSMDLTTFSYDLHSLWHASPKIDLNVGLNGMLQTSRNTGSEFLIPDDEVFDAGLFAVATMRSNDWDFSAGLRYDHRLSHADAMFLDSSGQRVDANQGSLHFASFDHSTPGLSASVGASRQFGDNLTLKANIGRGFRSPAINELASNGVHEGTFRYETGNSGLASEANTQLDLGMLYQDEHLHVEFSLFYNQVDNFIFSHSVLNGAGADSLIDGFRLFHYDQASALLYGFECVIDYHPHPLDWLHIENAFALVRTTMPNQPDSSHTLPFSPAPKWTPRIKASSPFQHWLIQHASLSLGADIYFAQNNIYSAYQTETPTPAYTVCSIQGSVDLKLWSEQSVHLSLGIENVFDSVYQNHLSRLKYTDLNPITQKAGVFAMGRRFVAQLSLPITF